MTLGELEVKIKDARKRSPLGADTVVCLCEYEREYEPITGTTLEIHDASSGALFLLITNEGRPFNV